MTYHYNFNGNIKKDFRLQQDQGCCLSSNAYEVAMHNRIHLLIYLYSVRVWGRGGRRTVCMVFPKL